MRNARSSAGARGGPGFFVLLGWRGAVSLRDSLGVARPRLQAWRLPILASLYLASFLALDLAAGRWLLRPAEGPRRHAVPHPVYHHDLAPGVVDSPDQWGPLPFRVTTNSLGFRDVAPRQIPIRSEGERTLLVGDSFVFGVGYDYPLTFAALFTAAMAEAGVEVLNAAVVSYSPIIHVRKLERLLLDVGLEVDEVVVFLDISDTKNDALDYELDEQGRVVFSEDQRWGSVLRRALPFSSELWTRAGAALGFGRQQAAGWSTRGTDAGMWTVDDALYEAWGRRGLEAMASRMDRILALLRSRGVRLTVVVYPWPDQILAGDRESRQVAFWRSWCEERSVPFLDLFPDFIAGQPAENQSVVERYFIPGDVHFNRAGNRYFAELLIERLGPSPPGPARRALP